jgi:hypothetical protein
MPTNNKNAHQESADEHQKSIRKLTKGKKTLNHTPKHKKLSIYL